MLTKVDVRRRRIGGVVAALIGVVLLVLAFLAFTGRLGATGKSDGASDEAKSAGAETSQTADPSQPGETGQPADPDGSDGSDDSGASGSDTPADVKVPLTVLNAGAVAGLAATGQAEFEAGGWEVSEVGNYVGDVQLVQSTVFYPGGDEELQASAEALAEQFPELAVEESPDDLGYDGVVVVLASDWVPGG